MAQGERGVVFLTGATGFIGRHALRELLARGYRVRCLARPESVAKLPTHERVEPVGADILSPRGYTRQVGGCCAVVHLAGILIETSKATFRGVHIEGTCNIVTACQKMDVRRFIHMSALGVGPSPDIRYFQSKHEAEKLVRASQLDWTILRPSVVHGPGNWLIEMLCWAARKGLPVPVVGLGRQRLQPVYVEDVARLLADALERPATVGQAYEVGGSQVLTYAEMVDAIFRAARGRRARKIPVPPFLARWGMGVLERLLHRPPFAAEPIRMLKKGNVCETLEPVQRDFGFVPAGFEGTLGRYIMRNP